MTLQKLKMHSPDLTAANIAKLAELFPNCVTEAKGAKGELKQAIDFDLLRQELVSSVVEGPQERYQLNWPGKREALLTANAPIARTLRPCREESVDFDTTRNLFIEGDNLDALKLLQETYLNKVKLIYIDPPYNTGKEFLYDDDFSENSDKYFRRSNQKDAEGSRLVANGESNGRFHSDWLSMMYPRLKLARNLLSPNGIIFISIHDAELANLRKLCDEVFGGDNFVGQLTWKARVKPVNIGEAKYRPQKEVEYVLVYQRQLTPGSFFPLYTGGVRSYPHQLGERRYRLTTILKSNRGTNQRSTMTFQLGDYSPPDGQRWQAGEDVISQLNNDGYIEFRDGTPFRRYFEDEEGAEHDPFYCFMEVDWASTSEAGKNQLNQILGDRHDFDTVKPVRLIKTLVQSCTSGLAEDVILDFFSGSATTSHAVMELNAEDGGKRRHILVQLPESNDVDSDAYKAGFTTIAEIGKERIRRSSKKIKEENADKEGIDQLDIGFRVLKIDTSNMKEVYYTPDAVTQEALPGLVDNIRADRTAEDLLFQVLLDWGVDLALPISRQTLAGKTVFFVDGNALAACFDTGIDEDFVKQLAAHKPLRVVFRDAGFISDSVKINVEQVFKLLSPATEIKTL
jgi:adenine-specific DNA-methyltransferase